MVLFSFIMLLIVIPPLIKKTKTPPLPREMVLFFTLENGLFEIPSEQGLSALFEEQPPPLKQLVDALENAATDKRVQALVVRMDDGDFDMAHATEFRAALKHFRASGKKAYIYSNSYGEGGGGLGRYFIASAFDEIWMQPLGIVSITGVSAEIPFLRDTLDKIGLAPQFFQRKEYKSAYESLTNKTMSPANKEEMTALVTDIRAEILRTIPKERGMTPAQFESFVNMGLITAQEAKKFKLVTQIGYGDTMLDSVANTLTHVPDSSTLHLVDITDYIKTTEHGGEKNHLSLSPHKKPKVALVYAVGTIMPSDNGGGLGDGQIVSADTLAPVLHDLADDASVKAVVLRIDSPGGSPSASESILHALEHIRKNKKPVIVSMGPLAASGGYWIASSADRIFALPTTLTGSIGVVGGKFAIGDLSQKLGVRWEKISWGKNAGLWSMNTPFSDSEAERMNAMMDQVYDSFIARVAKGRKMKPDAVEAVARGRVWTGVRAKNVGLVDEIGGLNEALDYAAKRLGQTSRRDVDIAIEPKPKTPFEEALSLFENEPAIGLGLQHLDSRITARLGPLLHILDRQDHPADYVTYEPLRVR